MAPRTLRIGRTRIDANHAPPPFELPAHHLVTHGVVLGMTGSGKTGLTLVLIEEALTAAIPTLIIDLKGDLPNLLLTFPTLDPAEITPWIDADAAARANRSPEEVAKETAERLRVGQSQWGIGPAEAERFRSSFAPRIITPGAKIGEPVDVLSSLSRRSTLWDEDEDLAREQLGAGISLLLRLAGRDADSRGREHVVLSALAERRMRAGEAAPLPALLADVLSPPIASIGAMTFDDFLPPKERQSLAQDLNALLASPKLATWLSGAPLAIGQWLKPGSDGRAPAVIVSVAHLDDDERQLVLGLLLDELLAWVRGLSGTSDLRALVVFDEVYGYLPPHPANPPTKKPLLTLLKQARAFGVGVVVCTQNPMDLDYKALSNAGAWFVGRLQTDADRERVVEGLSGSDGGLGGLEPSALGNVLRNLPPRAFFVRDVHRTPACEIVDTRHSICWMRGPFTRRELGRLAKEIAPIPSAAVARAPSVDATIRMEGAPPVAATITMERAPARSALVSEAAPAATSAAGAAPASPPQWRTHYAHVQGNGATHYVPYVAATVLLRGKDVKLGVLVERQHCVIVPLDATGKPDLSRAALIDPHGLTGGAAPRATYAELHPSLLTQRGAQTVEKAIREFVVSRFPPEVLVNRALRTSSTERESRESFLHRCRMEAQRAAASEQHEIAARYAPKIAKLEQRIASAQRDQAAAQQAAEAGPGDLGTAFLRVALGRNAVAPLAKARSKAQHKAERAHAAATQHYASLEALRAEQHAEISAMFGRWHRDADVIETLRLHPKRGDADVVSIGIAWSAQSAV